MSDSLPEAEFWDLIHPHTGDLTSVQRTPRGFSSDLTALVESEKGPFFVKAVANRPGGRRDSIVRERDINPFVRPISPELLWYAESEKWIVLGFAKVEGRSADFTPEPADLPASVELLGRIGRVGLPEIAWNWAESRWDRFAESETQAALFAGNALLYTDINPSNLLIGAQQSWAVDWAWPTRGAAFIDPACLVLQLIAAGHSAESAEGWAGGCAAWVGGERKAVDAFAAANVRMYRSLVERKPDAEWLRAMLTSAEAWATHRGVTLP